MTPSLLKRFEDLVKGRMPADMMLVEISRPEWEAHIELCKDFLRTSLTELKEAMAAEKRDVRPEITRCLSGNRETKNTTPPSTPASPY